MIEEEEEYNDHKYAKWMHRARYGEDLNQIR
jgi:hypothetical protein